jgi:hypothetical protein
MRPWRFLGVRDRDSSLILIGEFSFCKDEDIVYLRGWNTVLDDVLLSEFVDEWIHRKDFWRLTITMMIQRSEWRWNDDLKHASFGRYERCTDSDMLSTKSMSVDGNRKLKHENDMMYTGCVLISGKYTMKLVFPTGMFSSDMSCHTGNRHDVWAHNLSWHMEGNVNERQGTMSRSLYNTELYDEYNDNTTMNTAIITLVLSC